MLIFYFEVEAGEKGKNKGKIELSLRKKGLNFELF